MEKLSLAINEFVAEKKWQPVKVIRNGPWVSHLLFADDVLLFTKANSSQARLVACLFDKFSKSSGLKVNLTKSRDFYSSGVPREKIEKCTSISLVRSMLTLDRYLGFSILKRRVKKADFDFIIEKMKSRLASWKHRFLNKPGRLALATSVLTSIPNYYMYIFWLLQSICSLIDRVTREFIWKGNASRSIHIVGWDKITMRKSHGGLGERRAKEANTSLLGKLVWDLHHCSSKLWVRVLLSKYHCEGSFMHGGRVSRSCVWNSIIKARDILKDGYSLRVGVGNVSFWYEPGSRFGTFVQSG